MIKQKRKHFNKEKGNVSLKAANGWLEGFLQEIKVPIVTIPVTSYKVAQYSDRETNLKFFRNEPTKLFALYLHLCGLILENFQICLTSRVLRNRDSHYRDLARNN